MDYDMFFYFGEPPRMVKIILNVNELPSIAIKQFS